MGILSASLHSHPLIPKLKVDEPLKGVLLLSAWAKYQSTSRSFHDNQRYDIVPPVGGLVDDYRAHAENDKDPFFEPGIADSKWWTGAPVSSILNLAGTHELLFDDLVSFGEILAHAELNVRTVTCERQVHVDAILDAGSGLEPGQMSWAIWKWLERML